MPHQRAADVLVMEFYRADRPFRTWQYSVSHSRLLLRSVDWTEPRIDVHFMFVSAFKLPNSMRSLCLRDPLDHERPSLKAEIEAVDSNISIPIKRRSMPMKRRSREDRLFVLEAGNGIGWVVALGMRVFEDPDRWASPGLGEGMPSASEVIYVSRTKVRRHRFGRT